VGDTAWVAGTTATVRGEVVGVGDAYEQTRVAFGIVRPEHLVEVDAHIASSGWRGRLGS